MNSATNKIAKPPRNFREREHRFTKMPVKDILTIRMKDLGMKNVDLQKALGYGQPNVIAMMKNGSMRLPENKAVEAARILELDPVFMLGKVVSENNPALWDSMVEVMGSRLLTVNELALLDMVRKQLDGHDVDLAKSPEFVQAVTPVLNAIFEQEDAARIVALKLAAAAKVAGPKIAAAPKSASKE